MAGNANSGRREQHFLSALLMELKESGKDMPRLRNIAKQLIAKAEEGDLQAIKEFVDRLDGKPRQAVELSDPDGGALQIVVKQFKLEE